MKQMRRWSPEHLEAQLRRKLLQLSLSSERGEPCPTCPVPPVLVVLKPVVCFYLADSDAVYACRNAETASEAQQGIQAADLARVLGCVTSISASL